MIEKNIR